MYCLVNCTTRDLSYVVHVYYSHCLFTSMKIIVTTTWCIKTAEMYLVYNLPHSHFQAQHDALLLQTEEPPNTSFYSWKAEVWDELVYGVEPCGWLGGAFAFMAAVGS